MNWIPLSWLAGDEQELRLHEAREHARIEHNSLMWEAEQRGKLEARLEGKLQAKLEAKREIALNLLNHGFNNEFVSVVTEIPLAEVDRIRQTNLQPPSE